MKAKMRDGVLQRGRRSWAFWVRVDQNARWPKMFTVKGTRQDALKKRRELQVALDKGTFVMPTKLTVTAWFKEWLEKAVRPPARSGNTYRSYSLFVKKHIDPEIGGIVLQRLGPADLKRLYMTRESLSETSRAVLHGILHAALEDAVREGHLVSNPADRVVGKPRARRHENVNFWSPEDQQAVIKAAEAFGPQIHALVALALDSGMRRGEYLALRWADLDLDTQKVSIVHQLLNAREDAVDDPAAGWEKQRFGPTKSRRGRVITLAPETVALLRKHKQHQAELKMKNRTAYLDHNLVFAREFDDLTRSTDRLGMPLRPASIGPRVFDRVAAAANVRAITCHGTRHSTATTMLLTEPVHAVSRHLGHANAAQTLNTYAHLLPAQEREAAARRGKALHG
jgi:integrase